MERTVFLSKQLNQIRHKNSFAAIFNWKISQNDKKNNSKEREKTQEKWREKQKIDKNEDKIERNEQK